MTFATMKYKLSNSCLSFNLFLFLLYIQYVFVVCILASCEEMEVLNHSIVLECRQVPGVGACVRRRAV